LETENKRADEDPGVLRISFDAKNKVAIGDFSRGGKNWTGIEAGDHDFAKEHITPFGLYIPEFKETALYFTSSKVTADFIGDIIIDYWGKNKNRFKHIHTLLLNADNGPECHSRRTQFIKRICEFARDTNLVVKLVYYPPYHSKYNPVERVWGGLEQHWNGDIMDTKETVLKFAQNFIWAEKKATVKVWDRIYETGKKLSVHEMELHEQAIDRLNKTIGKWFVTIYPDKVKKILCSG
jgi:DDE family transposase